MRDEIQFLLYSLPEDTASVQVVIRDETIWCTQKAMAQLFGVGVPAVSKHLKNIYEEGELQREMTVSKMEIVTRHGAIEGTPQTSRVDCYNLDAIAPSDEPYQDFPHSVWKISPPTLLDSLPSIR